jgi:hypothetical protein
MSPDGSYLYGANSQEVWRRPLSTPFDPAGASP